MGFNSAFKGLKFGNYKLGLNEPTQIV